MTFVTAVGVRRPPPPPGMQPARGRNVGGNPPIPTYLATNTMVRDVVRPGATGLPEAPRNQTSIARSVTGGVVGGDVLLLHDSDAYAAGGSWRRTAEALPLIASALAGERLVARRLTDACPS